MTTAPSETIGRVYQSIKHFWNNLLTQPLDSIAEYYGESVAFYFAYMAFYTRWLVLPAILGLVVFVYQVRDMELDHWLCLPYSIVVMVWTCFLLVFWRQRSSALAFRWGVLDYEIQETERPQYKGTRHVDPETLEVRKYYPTWRKVLKYCISVPALFCVMTVMLGIMSSMFSTQDRISRQYVTCSR